MNESKSVEAKSEKMEEKNEKVGERKVVELSELIFQPYESESQLKFIQSLIDKDLSEPYSIFTYRYFLNNWSDLCILAMLGENCIGCIVSKIEPDKKGRSRGYIAMLAVQHEYRKNGIASELVKIVVQKMKEKKAELVVLETEITNIGALSLYERLDFVRDKRLQAYYMNGVDAFRLKLWLTSPPLLVEYKRELEEWKKQQL